MSGDRCLLCDEVEPGFEPREASTNGTATETPTMHHAVAEVRSDATARPVSAAVAQKPMQGSAHGITQRSRNNESDRPALQETASD